MTILQYLTQSRALLFTTGIVLVLITGFLDKTIGGVEVSFSLYYLVPIVLITWYANSVSGYSMAILSIMMRGWVDFSRFHLYAHPFVPIDNTVIRAVFFVFTVWAIDKIKNLLERERKFGTVDFLTGLANRRAFYDYAQKEANRCRRAEQPLTIAFIDCDDFKAVNDRYGHQVGHSLLRAVGDTMRAQLRLFDSIARLGGDEFAVLLPGTGEAEARQVLERLRIQLVHAMEKREWPVTFSSGAITMLQPTQSIDQMIHHADALMYQAKSEGKNTIRIVVA